MYCAMVLSSAQWMDMRCMNILGLMNTYMMSFLCWNNTEVRRVICSSSKQRGFSLPFRHSIELRARFCSILLHPAVSFHTLEQPIARSPHVHFVMEGGLRTRTDAEKHDESKQLHMICIITQEGSQVNRK